MSTFVWQLSSWPEFHWNGQHLLRPVGRTRQALGGLLAKADYFGLHVQSELLTEEAFTTAAIEGEKLDRSAVRSSVARRLGLPVAGLPTAGRHVDGLVHML